MNWRPGAVLGTLSIELRRVIVAACESFERAWRAGERPEIEPLLEGREATERVAVLRELITLEIDLRSRTSGPPTLQEYVSRFPEDADVVRAAFESTLDSSGVATSAPEPRARPSCEPTEPEPTVTLTKADSVQVSEERTGPDAMPERLGRYKIVRLLGEGGFGRVYLARDGELDRDVAIKVPTSGALKLATRLEALLGEARLAAGLRHHGIVAVHDVGHDEGGLAFVVFEYVQGTTLAEFLERGRFEPLRLAALVANVADAVHHAHRAGLVHRDLKPSNIIIDTQGVPRVADFGLAINEATQHEKAGEVAGTPSYMAPEQVRGEAHRLDGRTDVWALGVILYEGLTGALPFTARDRKTLFDEILTREPKPPRQRVDALPREIERICLNCLAKRMVDRYQSAADLAEDLRAWLAAGDHFGGHTGTSWRDLPKLVPKGLRAFDGDDASFFLSLLPGPRDREGLTETIRVWKSWIEVHTGNRHTGVGLLYGPSGCGKSSLVKAGLLPRLTAPVHAVTITATAESTEDRLLEELRQLVPQPMANLPEALQIVRSSSGIGRRVLIVVDQFEQWLHANRASADSELVRALRHCDGEHVACLLIVRDDFWMSAHRFFRELDISLAERENCAAVDLFDTRHARRVLHAFGHAYGALPERADDLTPEQREFLDKVIDELAEDDRVICVRLALFSQMVRNRPWVPETLTAIGGARGVGIRFLEDTFGSNSAPLAYRVHRPAVGEILRALLPAAGTDIKACARTAGELARAAQYDIRSQDFARVIAILVEETRLLTPVDAPSEAPDGARTEARAYQLTHDYLVPSIREWLTRRQRETWRGRCALRLAERAALWSARPERRQLPSLWETTLITAGTKSSGRTPSEAAMMRHAQRWHGRRLTVLGFLLVCATVLGSALNRRSHEALRRREADAAVDRLLVAEIHRVSPVIQGMSPTRDLWTERLRNIADGPSTGPGEKLRAEMALLPKDPGRIDVLLKLLVDADAETVRVVRDWLADAARPAPSRLWAAVRAPGETAGARLRIAALLAEFDPGAGGPWREIARPIAHELVTDFGLDRYTWAEMLMPVREQLAPPLADMLLDATATSAQRLAAAQLLSRLGSTDLLCRLVPEADPTQLSLFVHPLSRDREAAIGRLRAILDAPALAGKLETRLRQTGRLRTVAVALMLLGRADLVWPLLAASGDNNLRTELMVTMRRYGVPLDVLFAGEAAVRDPVTRQAIWQGMTTGGAEIPASERAEIWRRIQARWPHVTHQSERSGITWLAHQCGLSRALSALPIPAPAPAADWSTNSQGQVFLKIRGPVQFVMGSPADEFRHGENERQHERRIERSFAIAIHEVTAAQFHRFRADFVMDPAVAVTPDCPAIGVSWIDAAKYCRWLSEQEGVAPDQMCYPRIDQINGTMEFPSNMLSRTGYRLLTEAEWEYACRAGHMNRYFFGDDDRHISEFDWWVGNAADRTWPVGTRRPNGFGLFDMQGNVHEWCQDALLEFPAAKPGKPIVSTPGELLGLYPRELRDRNRPRPDRAFRGGNYRSTTRLLRSAQRSGYEPVESHFSIMGFRLARTLNPD